MLTTTVLTATLVFGFADADSPRPRPQPAPVSGCWDLLVETHFPFPDQRGRLSFRVEGSSLRGTVILHGRNLQVRDGAIDGNRVRFKVEHAGDHAEFEGELKDAELQGTMTRGRRRLPWRATRCRPSE